MRVARRTLLGAGLAAAATLTGCAKAGGPASVDPAGPLPRPSFSPGAGLAVRRILGQARYAVDVHQVLERYVPAPQTLRHNGFPGAVALVLVDGEPTVRVAVGEALRYGAGPTLLPLGERVAMRPDSIFDLASVTKVYTAILLLQQVERGRVRLDAPVVEYLPGFTGAGKAAVTVGMLLTHTSGLPVGATVTGLPDEAARWNAVLATPLVAGATPGTTFRYSSVGLMIAGRIVEKVTGQRLDQALRSNLTGPLGLTETGFTPNAWLSASDRKTRLVATDARSSRGLLRGVVHDDVANLLGGVAGHAGVFASAADVAAIGRLLLDAGTYGGTRVLEAATVRKMLVNANAGKPAIDPDHPTRTSAHGLGVVLNQPWFMGRLSSPGTFGHTGFTGTTLVVDPGRRLVLALLTNRAHPNWSWADPDPTRVAVADALAKAV
ncbi:serine hydrolase domain-containing protein [Rhizomonospora bruguierae]|uniref:serine hydrolase domain-containing protein n=1 Tax=Rhizomonospora bruguierae TaxID=1581705 RepID=UPI0020BF2A64|nr:serine hydrolase domain-containing protein [Micromonospora sp. NBRC 107566]